MEPRNWPGGSVDRSVIKRLHRLDPKLKVTFSPYALDGLTGNPIIADGYDDDCNKLNGPVHDPCFYLWRKSDQSGWTLVQVYPAAQGFGQKEVLMLEADLGRCYSEKELWQQIRRRAEVTRMREAKRKSNMLTDRTMDNKKLVMDVASGKTSFHREAKSFGYAGQTRRTSSAEGGLIDRDRRELGIEDL